MLYYSLSALKVVKITTLFPRTQEKCKFDALFLEKNCHTICNLLHNKGLGSALFDVEADFYCGFFDTLLINATSQGHQKKGLERWRRRILSACRLSLRIIFFVFGAWCL